MNEVLAMCGDLREIRIAKGESLIAQVLPDAATVQASTTPVQWYSVHRNAVARVCHRC
jgi:hypothetical protein